MENLKDYFNVEFRIPHHELDVFDYDVEDQTAEYFLNVTYRQVTLQFNKGDTLQSKIDAKTLEWLRIDPNSRYECSVYPHTGVTHVVNKTMIFWDLIQHYIENGIVKSLKELVILLEPEEQIWYRRKLLSKKEVEQAKSAIFGGEFELIKRRK